jgi:hypothetical protein
MFIPKFDNLLSILEFTDQTIGWGSNDIYRASFNDNYTISGISGPKFFKAEWAWKKGRYNSSI